MLSGLSIRDVVLIERLDLSFPAAGGAAGLQVLTGETGAGKSILLDALGLALGGRGDSGLVRPGAAQAVVAATFDLPADHPAHALLHEQGLDGDDTLVLRRVLGADGRGRALVNDQPVSVGLLRRLGETLVEIQGQFAQQGLLDPASHRDLLDDFGGLAERRRSVAAAWQAWRAAEEARQAAEEALQRARAEEDYLRHVVAELDALDPQPGEEAALAEERQLLRQAGGLAEAVEGALAELSRDRGVGAALRAAQRLLERQADKAGGRLDAALAALERAAVEAAEAVAQIEAVQQALEADPGRLERIEERLFALRAAARKHQLDVAGLPELRERLARQLQDIDDGGARLAGLVAGARDARAAYAAAAEALSAARAKAAGALAKAVAGELPPLKLEKARFVAQVERLPEADWGAAGMDRVTFLISTNPGLPAGPLNKVASGGELSRFMLALKVVLARTSTVTTLVFDEVDSGIGGATAAAVGERLARLAGDVQVLVVTHSPQVAARADHHWRIGKRSKGGKTVTEIVALDAAERREEVARMLAGSEVTEEARAAAQKLIASRR